MGMAVGRRRGRTGMRKYNSASLGRSASTLTEPQDISVWIRKGHPVHQYCGLIAWTTQQRIEFQSLEGASLDQTKSEAAPTLGPVISCEIESPYLKDLQSPHL